MTHDSPKLNLSQIDTRWSLIIEAHQGEGDAASQARCELMVRYSGAVQRYLLCVAGDPEVAADLAQEFALRFLRGDFHRADPQRGRFRNYVKSAILNLLVDHRRREKHRPRPLPADGVELCAEPETLTDLDRQFLDCSREEILRRAWERLSRLQDQTGQPYFTVLSYRAEHPSLRSHEMAIELSRVLGKPLTAGWVRQNLRRGRERFVDYVQGEVADTLGPGGAATGEELDDELRDLGLWSYCRVESS